VLVAGKTFDVLGVLVAGAAVAVASGWALAGIAAVSGAGVGLAAGARVGVTPSDGSFPDTSPVTGVAGGAVADTVGVIDTGVAWLPEPGVVAVAVSFTGTASAGGVVGAGATGSIDAKGVVPIICGVADGVTPPAGALSESGTTALGAASAKVSDEAGVTVGVAAVFAGFAMTVSTGASAAVFAGFPVTVSTGASAAGEAVAMGLTRLATSTVVVALSIDSSFRGTTAMASTTTSMAITSGVGDGPRAVVDTGPLATGATGATGSTGSTDASGPTGSTSTTGSSAPGATASGVYRSTSGSMAFTTTWTSAAVATAACVSRRFCVRFWSCWTAVGLN